jgi:dihydroorotate dehydrogenase
MALFSLIRPLVFALDAETAHSASIAAVSLSPLRSQVKSDGALSVDVAGLHFANPVGLAAGYDKDARVPLQMLGLGFGFVEVGTLTPLPQAGNPKPRLFRLAEDRAVINRMGFNNCGQDAAFARLAGYRTSAGIIGVNIGANKDSANRISDYVKGVEKMRSVARYLTINISSPNTPGLRALQGGDVLDELLNAVVSANDESGPPLFLKVAPDLTPAELDAIAKVAVGKVDALIISNTTTARPLLLSRHGVEAGGLSGAPLRDAAQQCLVDFRKATGAAIPLIGAGGIATAADAYARIRAGASLIQLYSALVYEGPGLARGINSGLRALMKRDGINKISDAIGIDAR